MGWRYGTSERVGMGWRYGPRWRAPPSAVLGSRFAGGATPPRCPMISNLSNHDESVWQTSPLGARSTVLSHVAQFHSSRNLF